MNKHLKLVIGTLCLSFGALADCPADIATASVKDLQKFFPANAIKPIQQGQGGTFNDYTGPDAKHVKACANESPTVRGRLVAEAPRERPRSERASPPD